MKETETVQQAVNVMGAILKENSRLRSALGLAQSNLAVMKEAAGSGYRISYAGSNPVKYTEIADKAISAITEVLNK